MDPGENSISLSCLKLFSDHTWCWKHGDKTTVGISLDSEWAPMASMFE